MEEASHEPTGSTLLYVWQPVVDVGVATIVAFSGRDTPQQVTEEDLDKFVTYIISKYMQQPLKSALTTVFPNAGFLNPNPSLSEEWRRSDLLHYLTAYKNTEADVSLACVFCGRPAPAVVYRQHIPLTAAERQINFGPSGRPGISICGGCLLASQALPLGCAIKCGHGNLMVHSDNTDITLHFASSFLRDNQRKLSLADANAAGSRFPRTIVVNQLMKIARDRNGQGAFLAGSLTAYHFSNYGSNADVAIYHLPSEALDFLKTAQNEKYHHIWQSIVDRAWEQPKEAKKRSKSSATDANESTSSRMDEGAKQVAGTWRNALYEDLFGAFTSPLGVTRFIRRYFLGIARKALSGANIEADLSEHLSLVSWDLTAMFLRKALKMDSDRIEAIRNVGDRLVKEIDSSDDKNLLRSLYIVTRPAQLRTALLRASYASLKAGNEPIIGFDEFITIFEYAEDYPRPDWSLARDLIYIKVLDGLYKLRWFDRNQVTAREVLEEIQEVDTQQEESEGVEL